MQIIHPIDNFFFTLFPELNNQNDLIISYLTSFYTYENHVPKVEIKDGLVIVNVDINAISQQNLEYNKAVSFCEKGKFKDAKPILERLVKVNPTVSEYHRILGQIHSDEGNQDEAIDFLIDALRWNSKNGYALLMLGNIFAKFKNDIKTAMTYYDQALIANPNDNIAINNIGANLMQQGKLDQAKKYFWEAVKVNDKYPNTHFALGMIAQIEGDLDSAFYSTIKAIQTNKNSDILYQNSVRQLFDVAKEIIKSNNGRVTIERYKNRLELEGNVNIEITEDSSISTAAKIEYAENYKREFHKVIYKSGYPAVEHLIMHELVHYDFALQARKEELNQLFISNSNQKSNFIKDIESSIKKLRKMGISEDSISNFCNSLFDGINTQTFNTPIDLFIEDFLYKEYSELRPYQFLSLYQLVNEGIKAVTDKKIVEIAPKDILSKSKIYNIVNALQFKELFGFDFIKDFKATPAELKQAEDFFNEYKDYTEDKAPAEEYELVSNWAKDLKLDNNFELVGEAQYRNRSSMESFLSSMETDPLGIDTIDPIKEMEMKQFQQSQAEIGTNMAVVMFMVDALQYFKNLSKEDIHKIAFEIAMQGTQGFHPDKKDYRISSIPDKVFSGYHILAFYYVSWALAIPDMLADLKLPFDNEYQLALTLHTK